MFKKGFEKVAGYTSKKINELAKKMGLPAEARQHFRNRIAYAYRESRKHARTGGFGPPDAATYHLNMSQGGKKGKVWLTNSERYVPNKENFPAKGSVNEKHVLIRAIGRPKE